MKWRFLVAMLLVSLDLSRSDGGRIPLMLAGFADIDIQEGGWSSAGCIPAIELALQDVNNRDDILPGYHLNWTMQDGRCMAGNAIHNLFTHLRTPPVKIMVLGGGCSIATAPVARTTPYFNLVQMSYSSGSGELADRSTFSTFFRTAASDLDLNGPHLFLMDTFNWKQVATLNQDDPLFSMTINDLQSRFAAHNITQIISESFAKNPHTQLVNIKAKDARIIVLAAYEKQTRLTFCEVYKLGMYGPDYQWLIPGWFTDDWYNVNDTDCTAKQVKVALQYAITFSDHKSDDSGEIGISNQTYSQYLLRYQQLPSYKKYGYNDFHTVSYDAVWAVALALDKAARVLQNEGNLINVTEPVTGKVTTSIKNLEHFTYEDDHIKDVLFDLLSRSNFLGVSGNVSFQSTGGRQPVTLIKQIQDGLENRIALYYESTNMLKYYTNSKILWFNGHPPLDGVRVNKVTSYIEIKVFGAMASLAVIGTFLAVIFLSYNTVYIQCRYIKMSSPRLNNLIVVGGILCYWSVILFGIDGKFLPKEWIPVSCMIQISVLAVGFSLSFGAMFAKTWRVHVIFTQKVVTSRKSLQDQHLYLFVASLVFVDIGVLVAWICLDHIRVEMTELSRERVDSSNEIVHEIEICESDYKIYWLCAFYAKNGLLLIFGVFLAYETRRVHVPAMNDSKYIGMCVYNVIVMSVMGVTISLVLRTEITVSYVFATTSIIFCDTGALLLLFIPKISHLQRNKNEKNPTNAQTIASQSNTFQYTLDKMRKNLGSADSGLDRCSISRNVDYDNNTQLFVQSAVVEWKKQIELKDKELRSLREELEQFKQHPLSTDEKAIDSVHVDQYNSTIRL